VKLGVVPVDRVSRLDGRILGDHVLSEPLAVLSAVHGALMLPYRFAPPMNVFD